MPWRAMFAKLYQRACLVPFAAGPERSPNDRREHRMVVDMRFGVQEAGATLVHFSAHAQRFLTQNTAHSAPHTP
jgi:hypothetical protein